MLGCTMRRTSVSDIHKLQTGKTIQVKWFTFFKANYKKKKEMGWVWWLRSVIPALWEAEVGRYPRSGV